MNKLRLWSILFVLTSACALILGAPWLWIIVIAVCIGMCARLDKTPRHFHLFAFHKHPDWHGHCQVVQRSINIGGLDISHSCNRWHFHGPFFHRHTETGL